MPIAGEHFVDDKSGAGGQDGPRPGSGRHVLPYAREVLPDDLHNVLAEFQILKP